MIAIDEMVRQPLAQALGWALLQFLWQGTLIGVLTAALLMLLRGSAADVRYVVSTVALALMLTMPVVTTIQTVGALQRGPHPAGPGPQTTPATDAAAAVAGNDPVGRGLPPSPKLRRTSQAPPQAAAATAGNDPQTANDPGLPPSLRLWRTSQAPPIDQWLPMLVSVWLAGVAMLTLRLLSGWVWVQRMKSHDAHPVHEGLEMAARRLMRRLHIVRAVRFLESRRVDVPTVIGWLSPVVLLPASVLAGLTPHQVEAILAHELAHIRRHDYLVNLLQAVVETLLFYHPAVWWLSRRIRIERENCCDDLAVSLCGDPVAYAAALAELEGLRSANRELALAATGGSLLQRVKRLLGAPSHAGRAPGWLAAGLAVLIVTALSASAMNIDGLVGDRPVETDQFVASPAAPPAPVPVIPAVAIAAPARPAPADTPAPVVATTAPAYAVAAPQIAALPLDGAAVATTRAVEAVMAAVAPPASTEESIAAAMATTAAPLPAVAALATSPAVEPVVASPRAATLGRAQNSGEQSGNYSWSNNGQKFEVSYRGEIEFTADDADVARMSPGGLLRIKDGRGWLAPDTSVEFRADSSGTIQRRFWAGLTERPFEPEGRKWLAAVLPRFIRQSGIGAPARVARILKSGGVSGVLAEISRVEGSWGKRVYFGELMKSATLGPADVQRVLTQAGIEIDSDFELASFLISSNRLVADDTARRAYLDAARSIGSDFEMRRVLSSILKSGQLPSPAAAGLLDASTTIESDFEEASLLIQFAAQQALDAAVRAPFFKAVATVGSAFERGRVLQTVLRRTDLSPEARSAAMESAVAIPSDFEKAGVLLQYVKGNAVDGPSRAPFFRAVGTISSAFERGRVLQALAKRSDLSDETILDLLRAAQGINSHHERAQVLLAVASAHPLTRQGRDLYIDAADSLGDFEQGRVLSALVRNERRGSTR